jgi:hypothetical protein
MSISHAISFAEPYVGATYQQLRFLPLVAALSNSVVDKNVLPKRLPATTLLNLD